MPKVAILACFIIAAGLLAKFMPTKEDKVFSVLAVFAGALFILIS